MSSKYKVRIQEAIHFVTITIIDWIDIFIRPIYKHIIIDSLLYCQKNKGLVIHAYVLMTSHIHLIVSTKMGCKLDEIIRDFKKYTLLKEFKELLPLFELIQQNRFINKWLIDLKYRNLKY